VRSSWCPCGESSVGWWISPAYSEVEMSSAISGGKASDSRLWGPALQAVFRDQQQNIRRKIRRENSLLFGCLVLSALGKSSEGLYVSGRTDQI
jgi:hypothetical protein